MFKGTMIFIFLAVFATAGFVMAAHKGALDGKSFIGDTGEKGKETSQKDELIFAGGKYHSTGCDQYGFTAARYTTKKEGETTSFESETSSEKEGKISWKGTVKGDSCEATFVWTKPGQQPVNTGSKAH